MQKQGTKKLIKGRRRRISRATKTETAVAVRPNFTREQNKERGKKKRNLKEFAVPPAGAEVRRGKTFSGYKGNVFNDNVAMLTEPREARGASI